MDLVDGGGALGGVAEPGGDAPAVLLDGGALVGRAEADIQAAIDAVRNAALTGEEAVADAGSGLGLQERAFDGARTAFIGHRFSSVYSAFRRRKGAMWTSGLDTASTLNNS